MSSSSKYDPQFHHRRSIRLKSYDYSSAGLYFITLLCFERENLFGKIENGEMILNDFGKIAYENWLKTEEIRPQVKLDVFIIMPNHMHAIFQIRSTSRRGELHSPHSPQHEEVDPAKEHVAQPGQEGESISPLRGPVQTVGAVVRGYKSSVTKQLRLAGFDGEVWHRNYYEHIIKTPEAYENISNYILNNPAKWQQDKFFT